MTQASRTTPAKKSAAILRALQLAGLLEGRHRQITGSDIRKIIYPETLPTNNQPEDSVESRYLDDRFRKQFQRDRKLLEDQGVIISTREPFDGEPVYWLDEKASFIDYGRIPFSDNEPVLMLVAVTSMLQEPLFPLPEALRVAAWSLRNALELSFGDDAPIAHSNLATDALPSEQAEKAESLLKAVLSNHVVRIDYTNDQQVSSHREIEPYGLFLLDGRWYVSGWDSKSGDVRTFAVMRIERMEVTGLKFVPPANFDVRDSISLPFNLLGHEPQGRTEIIIPETQAHHLHAIIRDRGEIVPRADGGYLWTVEYSNLAKLCQYVFDEHLEFANPESLEARYRKECLNKVVANHG